MTLSNNIRKEEAIKLRESGMKILDIVDKTGLSKATLKRVFKKAGLTNEKMCLSHNKSEPSENVKQPEDKNVNEPIKSKTGLSENVAVNKEIGDNYDPSIKVTYVSYDKGNIIFVTGNNTNENIPVSEAVMSETLHPEKCLSENFVEKPPLFEHKTLSFESFKGDNLLYILLPVMLGAGLLMKGKLGEKGAFREEQNGGDW